MWLTLEGLKLKLHFESSKGKFILYHALCYAIIWPAHSLCKQRKQLVQYEHILYGKEKCCTFPILLFYISLEKLVISCASQLLQDIGYFIP